MNPQNRVVILTGATQGIGRATALTLGRAGCRLALVARNVDTLTSLAAELQKDGHEAVAIPTDMGDTAQVSTLVQKTIAAFGQLDVVINNAGIGVSWPVEHLPEKEARRVMDVNYFGPLALIQAALPHLRANPDGGLIVNISSIVGWRAVPRIGGYCASKGALDNMTESLRVELMGSKIRVSSVYPGLTRTNFSQNSMGHAPSNRHSAGLMVPPERVARIILKAIRYERRDLFVSLVDRLFVATGLAWPWLMDYLIYWYMIRFREYRSRRGD